MSLDSGALFSIHGVRTRGVRVRMERLRTGKPGGALSRRAALLCAGLLAACAPGAGAAESERAPDESNPTCTAVYLAGQEGEEVGRRSFEVRLDQIGEFTPVDACLVMAGKQPVEKTLVIRCTCE